MDLDHFPRVRFAHLPTPLEPMHRLGAALGGPRLFVKRDDCTGLATGGNKTRKLEFLIADALDRGADVVLTQGAVQSNHARQTAAAACRHGLDCRILLEQRVADAPSEYAESGNVFLNRLFGAEVSLHPGGVDMVAEMQRVADELEAAGRRPYVIPGGGSNPIGALGYADCARELHEQAAQTGLRVDHIVHATGSSGTQAGLLAGLAALGWDVPVHGIGVRFDKPTQEQKVHALAGATAERLGVSGGVARERVVAFDEYVGPGYGAPTPGMVEAIEIVARTEGLLLDPVYSGKGMAGLIDLIRNGRFGSQENVVFVHTGGSAALFGYRWAFDGAR